MASQKGVPKVMAGVAYANRTGLCPVCQKWPRARWKDSGELRIVCGDDKCFHTWLGIRPQHHAVLASELDMESVMPDADIPLEVEDPEPA